MNWSTAPITLLGIFYGDIMKDSGQRSDFLEFCHCYDSNPFVCGMGKDNLLAQGEL